VRIILDGFEYLQAGDVVEIYGADATVFIAEPKRFPVPYGRSIMLKMGTNPLVIIGDRRMNVPLKSNGMLSSDEKRQSPEDAMEDLAKLLAVLKLPDFPPGFRVSAAIVVMVIEDPNANASGVNAVTVGAPMSIPARLGSLELAKQMIVEQLFQRLRGI
jgi:hypothetical protein